MRKVRTLQDFIEDSNVLHNNKYDYSQNTQNLNEIVLTRSQIVIVCPDHGEFQQKMGHHLEGRGCMSCAYQRKVLTKDQFIERSMEKHENKYDYSQSEYIHSEQLIKIICPIHGQFKQTPESHMSGRGCHQCGIELKNAKNRSSFEEFVEKSKIHHGDFYSYEKSIYVNSNTSLTITCPFHGDFEQEAYSHSTGRGCPICGKESKGEKQIAEILELNNIKFTRQKTFDDCRHPETNWKLRFDFYLPLINILIEYDGIQHFKPIHHWGGQKALDGVRERDQIKTDYCKTVEIPLLRISYLEKIKESLSKANIFL